MTDEHQSLLRFRFFVLLGSHVMIFVGSGSLFLIAVTLKELSAEFGWPREAPAGAFALQFVGGGLGGLLMGYLLDRIGAAVLPVVATFAVVSGSILTTLVDTQWQLFAVFLLLFGFLGQGSLYAPLMANISKWYERRRGMAVGIVASGQSLSGIIWPPIFGVAVTEVGWRNGFIGFGIIAGCIMLPMCLIFIRKPPSTEKLKSAEDSEAPDRNGIATRASGRTRDRQGTAADGCGESSVDHADGRIRQPDSVGRVTLRPVRRVMGIVLFFNITGYDGRPAGLRRLHSYALRCRHWVRSRLWRDFSGLRCYYSRVHAPAGGRASDRGRLFVWRLRHGIG